MHKTLERQIKKHLGDTNIISPELRSLFEIISGTYDHFDDDRSLVERSLEISSRELDGINNKLKSRNENLVVANRALVHEKAQTEALLMNIGDGIVAMDNDGKVTVLNSEAENLLGWEKKDAIGLPWADIIKSFDEYGKPISYKDQSIPLVFTTRQKISINITDHFYYKNKNGKFFPIASTVSPVIVNDEVAGVIDIFKEITREIDIDRAKTEFVSLASHQLRTPLSTVKWYAELLLAGDAGEISDSQRKYLDEIYRGNQRMIDLVNALLNVSRIDLGTFIIDVVPTDFRSVADVVIYELRPMINDQAVKVIRAFEDDLPSIPADPKLVKVIIQNLLSNAVKYTQPNGEVNLAIKKHDDSILIVISDNGFGIPRSQQGKIFTKLFRADNVREKETTGTGLGLYIVKSIVDQAGGRIWFESEENKGTTFYVSIPLEGMKKNEGMKQLT